MKIRNTHEAGQAVGLALNRLPPVAFAVKVIHKTSGGKMSTNLATTENRRWMLVDDNAEVLLLLSAVIEMMAGVETECFSSPQSALAAFAAAPETYELVITDLEMPDLDGVELCRRLLAQAPALKIFLATGNSLFTATAAANAGFAGLLHKPFQLEKLRATLAAAKIRINEPVAA